MSKMYLVSRTHCGYINSFSVPLMIFKNNVTISKYEHNSLDYITTETDNSLDKMVNPKLMSHIWINNETGDIFDIKELCTFAHSQEKLFYTDATQAFGKVKIDVVDTDIDFMTFSGHKTYAPKGVAVLYCKNTTYIKAMLHGGHQEKGFRASTENVPAIVGMGKAFELYNYSDEINSKMIQVKKDFIKYLDKSELQYYINHKSDNVSPYILNISFPNINGETLQLMLNQKNIYVSTSSACSSGNNIENRVLTAMGISKDNAIEAIRISFSKLDVMNDNYKDIIKEVAEEIIEVVKRLQCMR